MCDVRRAERCPSPWRSWTIGCRCAATMNPQGGLACQTVRTQQSICTRHVRVQRFCCLAGIGKKWSPGPLVPCSGGPCGRHRSVERERRCRYLAHLGTTQLSALVLTSRASWAAFLDQMLVDASALSWIHVHKTMLHRPPPVLAASSPLAVQLSRHALTVLPVPFASFQPLSPVRRSATRN
jgi:hypothetical protein